MSNENSIPKPAESGVRPPLSRAALAAQRRSLAGCSWLGYARSNGALVAIYNAAAQDMDVDGRWAVVCEEHGYLVGVDSLRVARDTVDDVVHFCECCNDAEART